MANYRAVSAGVWSALARWQDDSTGSYVASTVLPGATDIVYANNFTVTLDIDVVVLELRTTSALNVNAGGLFDFGAGNSVTANCFAGTTTCVRNNTAGSKFVVGNVTGGTSGVAFGVYHLSIGTTTITGNLTANIGAGGTNGGTGTLTVNGIVTGGAGVGIDNHTAGTIIVNGSVIGGAVVGARNLAQGTMRVTTAVASLTAAGIEGSVTGITTVNNTQDAVNGRQACTGLVRRTNTGAKTSIVYQEAGTAVTLVDNTVPNYPLEADVEQGVGYGPGNIYTGTLVASITPQDIFTAIANSSDPVAVRLRNVSTVATTAATVASFDV